MKTQQAKPILVIRTIPEYFNNDMQQLALAEKSIRDKFEHEYHLMILTILNKDTIEEEDYIQLEVLNVKDLDGITLQEFKDKIKIELDAITRPRESDTSVLGEDKGTAPKSELRAV